MKPWTVGVAAAFLFIAQPVCAQESRPVALELGGVAGIINQPYASVGVVAAPWAIRVSSGGQPELVNCYGLQLNVGRVLRDAGNAKHTIGAMWGDFRYACWYQTPYTATRNRQIGGQYAGVAYDFQVKGFFIEVGPAFGAKNPVLSELGGGPLTHVYGQIGYVHRFGKKYEDDD